MTIDIVSALVFCPMVSVSHKTSKDLFTTPEK